MIDPRSGDVSVSSPESGSSRTTVASSGDGSARWKNNTSSPVHTASAPAAAVTTSRTCQVPCCGVAVGRTVGAMVASRVWRATSADGEEQATAMSAIAITTIHRPATDTLLPGIQEGRRQPHADGSQAQDN